MFGIEYGVSFIDTVGVVMFTCVVAQVVSTMIRRYMRREKQWLKTELLIDVLVSVAGGYLFGWMAWHYKAPYGFVVGLLVVVTILFNVFPPRFSDDRPRQ